MMNLIDSYRFLSKSVLARVVDAAGSDASYSVTCDPSGNFYLAGAYDGTASLKTQDNLVLGTLPTDLGGTAAFASKFDPDGNYQYSILVDNTPSEYGYSVKCDSTGSLYFSGQYGTSGSNVVTRQADGTTANVGVLPSFAAGTSGFSCKFNSAGTYQYGLLLYGNSGVIWDVAVDSTDSVYITGETATSNIVYVNTSGVTSNVANIIAGGGVAGVSCKFNSAGTFQYALGVRPLGATGTFTCNTAACDTTGNVYIAGDYTTGANVIFISSSNVHSNVANLHPNAGVSSGFACKFGPTGTYQYARIINSTSAGTSYSVTCDPLGSLYMAGEYNGTANVVLRTSLNVSTNVATLPLTSGAGGFTSKFDAGGTYQYSLLVDSATNNDRMRSTLTDPFGNLFVAGEYNSSTTPNVTYRSSLNVSTNVATLPVTTGISAFVSEFDPTGTYQYSLIVDGAGSDIGYSLARDQADNIYLAGQYDGTAIVSHRSASNISSNLAVLPLDVGGTAAFALRFGSDGSYDPYQGVNTFVSYVDSASTDASTAVALDSDVNIYISGYYNGTANIVTQAGSNVASLPASTGQAAFASKFDSSGAYQYSFVVDSSPSATETSTSITCDSSKNVYFCGTYNGTANVMNVSSLSVRSNVGQLPTTITGLAGFATKFDSAGVYQYSIVIDSGGTDTSNAVVCDSVGNVYFCGTYSGTANVMVMNSSNVRSNVATLPASSGTAAYACKFNSTGTYQYSFVFDAGPSVNDQGYGACVDSDNNIYVCGYLGGSTVKFVDSSNVATNVGTLGGGAASAGCSKFNSSGTYQYTVAVGGTGGAFAYGAACDSDKNLYVTGYYQGTSGTVRTYSNSNVETTVGTLPSTSGSGTVHGLFLSKFNSTGTYQYTLLNFSDSDGYNAVCDSDNNVYVSGYYLGTTPSIILRSNSNVSTTLATLQTSSGTASIVTKFDPSGTYMYSRIVDGSTAVTDTGYGVVCDSAKNVYLSGLYTGASSIETDSGSTLFSLRSPAGASAYLIKLRPDGMFKA